MSWPAKGYLKNLFGSVKAEGVTWDGVFITAEEGSEIKSIHHGKVAYADWLRGYGLLIIVDHGEGYMSLYGHNQSLFKEAGDQVQAGEPIALVGNSGGQNKPGLYFSIRKKGKPTNPTKWCVKAKGRKL
jgi:septal ring factor EnvC (AmiA/AmiB activator)